MGKLKTRKIQLHEGYAIVRQFTPLDNIFITELLGEKATNGVILNEAMVAWSLVKAYEFKYDEYPEAELFIDDPDFKATEDSTEPTKVPDMTKMREIVYTQPKTYEELIGRCKDFAYPDWILISTVSLQLNEPNPELLGKLKLY